jgi:hypothetical protein
LTQDGGMHVLITGANGFIGRALSRPLLTYGAHKLVGETPVAFGRHGWIDGRSLRIRGVLARPLARTGQLSEFMSDMVREMAAGRTFTCPMSPVATTLASSLPCVLKNLLQAATLPAASLVAGRCFTLPTLLCSMAQLVAAMALVHGKGVRDRVSYAPQERIESLFGRCPPLATAAADADGGVSFPILIESSPRGSAAGTHDWRLAGSQDSYACCRRQVDPTCSTSSVSTEGAPWPTT